MEELEPSRIRPLLLLGAGASRAFGVPTMDEFLDDSWERIRNDTAAGSLAIRRSLELEDYVDLEEVMFLLESLAAMEREEAVATVFLDSVNDQHGKGLPKFSGIRRQANQLLENLRENIFVTCTDYRRNSARETYHEFFGSLYKLCNAERIYIATTNYDRIIEDLWEDQDDGPHKGDPSLALQTGFYDPPYGRPELDVDRGYPQLGNEEDCAIHLIKLHGSLGWREYNSGTIEDTGAREYAEGDAVLAYPIRADKSGDAPFADLYDEFDRVLAIANLIIIVGSSLRDDAVVDRLAEALRPGDKIAVIVDPNPAKVRNQLPSSVRKYVVQRKTHFGPDEDEFAPTSTDEWGSVIAEAKEEWTAARDG